MSEALKSYPSDKVEALTMLYLQNQNLKDLTPEELAAKYKDVHALIKSSFLTDAKQRVNF